MYHPVFRVLPSGELGMGRPRPYQDRVWKRFYDDLLGPYAEPSVMLTVMEQMDLAYGRWRGAGTSEPGPGRGVPRAGFRYRRYLGAQFGANGASARRHAWQKSSLWEFWIPGCLSESSSFFFLVVFPSLPLFSWNPQRREKD